MRRALIVGIDEYKSVGNLSACITDVIKVAEILEKNGDGSPNFGVSLEMCPPAEITRAFLRAKLELLFCGSPNVALFYFSGHGAITNSGECIVTYDAQRYDEGISLTEILTLSNNSKATNKIIILDCCHAGSMGNFVDASCTNIKEGTTVLAACQQHEVAIENKFGGLFTSLLAEGLMGGASDLRGNISPGSLYAYIDRSLGPWEQRPVFKTNVSTFTSLRSVKAPIDPQLLRELPQLFATKTEDFKLSPEYEYTEKVAVPSKVAIFKKLQKFERVGLVIPVDEEHMYYAAMNSKSCRLTASGQHYWELAQSGKI